MDKYIILDIETNGIGGFRPPTQRAVQISWILENGTERDFYVKDVKEISESETYPCKHINIDILKEKGVDFDIVWNALMRDLEFRDKIIIHNVSFDIGVLKNEAKLRKLDASIFDAKTQFCTMRKSTNFCTLPQKFRSSSYKWPKLKELYKALFGDFPEDKLLHDSIQDCRILHRCYVKGNSVGAFT